jgi:cyclohexanone monooxygenase
MGHQSAEFATASKLDYEAIVVGAGFSGLAMLIRLRELGISTRVIEAGTGVGGTWYWNRYPGARTDCESYYYCYQFSKELLQDWNWTERYPSQPEMNRYLNHVADRFELRRDIEFKTRVVSARYDADANTWTLETDTGKTLVTRYFISAMGFISQPNIPPFKGLDSFAGETYFTGRWPHEGVDFKGKRVAVIGTGASAVQAIPFIAQDAAHLTVFQRTPNYVMPAQNHPLDEEYRARVKRDYDEIWKKARQHSFGMPLDVQNRNTVDATPEEQRAVLEEGWRRGGFRYVFETFDDMMMDPKANEVASEFIRSKIREIVKDPVKADMLTPKDYPFGGKRPPAGHGYYETFNRDNIALVDVRKTPIVEITPTGLKTSDAEFEFDILVLATGFDAVTGALMSVDIRGRDGIALKDKWQDGARTYLGLGSNGFPNLFIIIGPQSPFANMPPSIEQNVGFIVNAIKHLRENSIGAMEPTSAAENHWTQHTIDVAAMTIMPQGVDANSWFMGANIPGKARIVNVYFGGANNYFDRCDEVVKRGFEGYTFSPSPAA